MKRAVTSIPALLAMLLTSSARSSPCPSSIDLTGEDSLVAPTVHLLATRGIDASETRYGGNRGVCEAVHVHLERRDDAIHVAFDGASAERVVHGIETVATVIESFVRMDIASPLLEPRDAPVIETKPEPIDAPTSSPPPALVVGAMRGVHLFTSAETSVASDGTNWLGFHIGACITLGPLCVAARARHAAVVAGPNGWGRELERSSRELLLGLDVPLALGQMTLSPGFAAGLGAMFTRSDDQQIEGETGGLRADVHVTFSVPVTKRTSIELSTALDLTQETHVESEMKLPAEPLALWRFGAGVRYGGL